ncbi:SusC/RagA family TonB-linked outer membrane protein [Desertivirga brevis]|uniref:SusC/RagA family TonB-linked outer membrane protein n=1 Tax=Desertivirga brevis TaxID=2810310 RepID=UPI001A97A7D6|nr:SusC/RagA family TonB-linked outer membrane protein [Pedobacter sp. SYSU D00873]
MQKFRLFKYWRLLLLVVFANLFSFVVSAQTTITLRGRVVDEKGESLIGATVKVPGTNTGATTNANGDFTLNVPVNTTQVVITYIGYAALEKTVSAAASNLGEIRLAPNSKTLEQVVVVGYGTLKRQDMTGTVATVDSKVLQEIPASNVVEQLKGRVAGLDVVNGSNGPQITVRGNRTIGNPEADRPLIVLDGQPYYNSIENINPNDIKSVDVLKGASATAIYGSRGSGGVLLITTNRGRVGQLVANFDSYVGINRLQGQFKMLNGQQYAQLKLDASRGSLLQNNGVTSGYALTPIETQALAEGINTNWVDLYTQQGVTWDQNLRVSAGTEKTQFSAGLSYRKNGSVDPNNDVSRFTLTANIDHRINKVLKFGASLMGSLRNTDTGGAGQLGNAQWISPLAYPYLPDGSVNFFPMDGTLDAATLSPLVPATIPESYYNHTRGFVNNNIIYAELNPIEHLKYRYTLNYNISQSLQGQYNGINRANIQTVAQTNARTDNNYTYRLNQEHLLTYDNKFFDKHNVNFVAGFTTEKRHTENSNTSATNIPADAVRNTNLGLGTPATLGGSFQEQGIISYVTRLNYTFNDKYNLMASYRVDGNSALAKGHQYASYPAFGLGWVVSNEDFMKGLTTINSLKLRAGYGETSTIGSVDPYDTMGQLTNANYQFGGVSSGNIGGVRAVALVNPMLTWQRTAEYNLALDFGILRSRLTGSIEVYRQRTTGIILNNALPGSQGGGPDQPTNLGTSANKGFEFTLSSLNIPNSNGFSWSTDFNLALNREKIVELPNGVHQIIGTGLFVGQPLTTIYDLKRIGIWQVEDSPGMTAAGVYQPVSGQTSPLQYPGEVRVEDLNGDGRITSDDNQFIGNFQPDYTFGLTNRVSYKNFDLSIVVQGRMGFTTIVPYVSSNNSSVNGWQFLHLGRHNQPVMNYWTPENPTGREPMPNATEQTNFYSTTQYFDGSFIRAKSINLGYNIPGKVSKRLGLNSLRLFANITNPFIIYAPIRNHGFSVPDPESVSNILPANPNASGNVAGYNPNAANNGAATFRGTGISPGLQTRDFIFGINARF